MKKALTTTKLSSLSAQEVRESHRLDSNLPSTREFEEFLSNPSLIPAELRIYDLVFPQVVIRGMFEGQGDRVTDDSIAYLVFDGERWQKGSVLAGPRGWGYTGPDYFSLRARLAQFVS